MFIKTLNESFTSDKRKFLQNYLLNFFFFNINSIVKSEIYGSVKKTEVDFNLAIFGTFENFFFF